jgi:membrane-associated phospholipid phosphatase
MAQLSTLDQHTMVFVKSDATHVFHFGLLPGWNFSPDPVTEADTSHVFHFGLLRGGIVNGWPSSHATVAFAMAVTLFVLFRHKSWLGIAALLYAFYIGFGVAMSIHWFSDFASGAIFGTIIGTTVGRSFAAMEFKDKA